MNSSKVKNILGPVVLVVIYIIARFWLSTIVEVRNWQNIMLISTVAFFAFYVIANSGFNLNKSRAMCGILAIQILFCSFPYMLTSWAYVNLNVSLVDALFNVIYLTYQPFSIATSIMLIAVSLSPPGVFDDLASRFRVDGYLHRFNMRVGLYIFSVDQAMVK